MRLNWPSHLYIHMHDILAARIINKSMGAVAFTIEEMIMLLFSSSSLLLVQRHECMEPTVLDKNILLYYTYALLEENPWSFICMQQDDATYDS